MIRLIMIILLVLPLLFQLIFGIKAMNRSISLSFWKVSLISLLGQVLSTVGNLTLMSELIRLNNSRDGLPWIGVLAVEVFVGFLLVLTILIQRYIQYRRNKSLND